MVILELKINDEFNNSFLFEGNVNLIIEFNILFIRNVVSLEELVIEALFEFFTLINVKIV